jgi:hypothetical protein
MVRYSIKSCIYSEIFMKIGCVLFEKMLLYRVGGLMLLYQYLLFALHAISNLRVYGKKIWFGQKMRHIILSKVSVLDFFMWRQMLGIRVHFVTSKTCITHIRALFQSTSISEHLINTISKIFLLLNLGLLPEQKTNIVYVGNRKKIFRLL